MKRKNILKRKNSLRNKMQLTARKNLLGQKRKRKTKIRNLKRRLLCLIKNVNLAYSEPVSNKNIGVGANKRPTTAASVKSPQPEKKGPTTSVHQRTPKQPGSEVKKEGDKAL